MFSNIIVGRWKQTHFVTWKQPQKYVIIRNSFRKKIIEKFKRKLANKTVTEKNMGNKQGPIGNITQIGLFRLWRATGMNMI